MGDRGEATAAHWLRGHGFVIEQRRLRLRDGEVDVLARELVVRIPLPATIQRAARRIGRVVRPPSIWPFGWRWIAVEVKTGRSPVPPERAADDARLRRLELALQRLASTLRPPPVALRVDVVAIWLPKNATQPKVAHFPGAGFDPRARSGASQGPRPRRLRDST